MFIIKWIITKLIFTKLVKIHHLKYLPKNWVDYNGDNLFHYAAMCHSIEIFNIALSKNNNINLRNKKNMMPIHTFMECGFQDLDIINDEITHLKKIDYNIELLNLFIDNKADINAFIIIDYFDRQWGDKKSTYSRKNNMGSAIEILISLFWNHVISSTFDDSKQLEHYQEVYNILSKNNANINLIVQESSWGEEKIKDAMQDINSFIVSIFFVKYICNDNDLLVVLPILKDINLDFSLQDDFYNTVLHHLFGRINEKKINLSDDMIGKVFHSIILNPSFQLEHLKIQNSFKMTPLMMFKKDNIYLKEIFNNLSLYLHLNNTIENKPINKSIKVNKI